MKEFYEKRSYAKVNIFLKITGKRNGYHELASRFVRVKNLFDTVIFEKGKFDDFTLEGDFSCKKEQNTVYKAYLKLCEVSSNVQELFKNYKVSIKKNIPEFAGLGGGSSNCATFMIMVNEIANLNLTKDELSKIAQTVGADVPFFIYEYDSANVKGVGEIVEKFEEETLNIKTFTPRVKCDTGKIFKTFREKFYKETTKDEAKKLLNMKSADILKTLNIEEANDLYICAKDAYPTLDPKNFDLPSNSFFSGSGSSFFYVEN